MQQGDDTTGEDQPRPNPNEHSQYKTTGPHSSEQEPSSLPESDTQDSSSAFSSELDSAKNPASDWKYTGDVSQVQTSLKPVSWSASEFIDHEKQLGWYAAVGIIASLIALFVYVLTHDVISAVVIIMVAILFAVSGARKPRTLKYELDTYGIHIGNKSYGYNEFRSFATMQEGAISSIQLFQFKRFTTPISLYFPPDQEEEIINFLGSYLPHEVRSHDPIDRLMRKVRF